MTVTQLLTMYPVIHTTGYVKLRHFPLSFHFLDSVNLYGTTNKKCASTKVISLIEWYHYYLLLSSDFSFSSIHYTIQFHIHSLQSGLFLPVSIISSPSEGYNKRSYNCASVITSLSTSPKTSSKISKSHSAVSITFRT